MTDWKKNSIAVPVSIETLTMFASGDWRRKVDYTEEIPVPEQDWDDYYDALDDLRSLQGRDCWVGYDSDEEYIEWPRPRTIYHYGETEEEWHARVRAKLDAGEQPDNQVLKFNQDVVDYFFGISPLMEMQSRINDTHANLHSIGKAVDYSHRPVDWKDPTPLSADMVAEAIREAHKLDVFDKECDD